MARAIERQALLVNGRSLFDETAAPHHGVGTPVCARFSAPMSENVGVLTHEETSELLGGPGSTSTAFADEKLRRRVVEAGDRARELQKRADREVERLSSSTGARERAGCRPR